METRPLVVVGIIAAIITSTADAALAARSSAPAAIRRAALRPTPPPPGTAAKRAWVVCQVFGRRRCTAALNVAWCESTLRPHARNGQYRGIFQMGSSERRRFGHGSSAWAQARAARRYHQIAGWRPWECRP